MTTSQRGKRWQGLAVCLVVATTLATTLTLGAGPHPRNVEVHAALPHLSYAPTARDRIVVFAAHPDDETLGAGGLIHAAVRSGARVTIVVFTNGDGYIEGVDVGYHTLFSTPARFIEYGRERQGEALAAAAQLGVPASRVVFLSYPDRGLSVLWSRAWDCRRPYTSLYTRRNRSPYARTFDAESRYCGHDALRDVITVLRRERPTAVVVHHPVDTHPDHRAAEQFVTCALERLALAGEPWARTVRLYHYLVHHGPWPDPMAYAPHQALSPPPDLRTGRPEQWEAFPLSRSDEDAKRRAILEYRSQVRLLRTYMLSFVRRNELFDLYGPVRASDIQADVLPAAAQTWEHLSPQVLTPGAGSFIRATEGSAMLTAVAIGRSPDQILLALGLRRPAMREVQYRIEMRLFYPGGRAGRLLLRFQAPRRLVAQRHRPGDLALPAGAWAESRATGIEVALPLRPLGDPAGVYLHVLTVGPLQTAVDSTPWTMVRLP
jgi:LmbE family N-acetylglucosaminyl deacetylase